LRLLRFNCGICNAGFMRQQLASSNVTY
jgi:hypothetical protein